MPELTSKKLNLQLIHLILISFLITEDTDLQLKQYQ